MRWLGPVFVAVILPLLLSEFTDWCPWFAKRLVRRAVRRLPEDARARWEEEWLGDLASFEGRRLSILVRGLWIYFRAPSWGRMLQGLPPFSRVFLGRIRALVWRPKKEQQNEPSRLVWGAPGGGKSVTLGELFESVGETVASRFVATDSESGHLLTVNCPDGTKYRFSATAEDMHHLLRVLKALTDPKPDTD
jgi:hypothetical protein